MFDMFASFRSYLVWFHIGGFNQEYSNPKRSATKDILRLLQEMVTSVNISTLTLHLSLSFITTELFNTLSILFNALWLAKAKIHFYVYDAASIKFVFSSWHSFQVSILSILEKIWPCYDEPWVYLWMWQYDLRVHTEVLMSMARILILYINPQADLVSIFIYRANIQSFMVIWLDR